MNKDQLLSLTLRQLRQEASKLSVPLYSRKTKAVLVDLIFKYQEKSVKKTYTNSPQPKFAMEIPDYQDIYIPKGRTQKIRINLAQSNQE